MKIYLQEKSEDYLKCFKLYMEGMKVSEAYTTQESKARVYQWIRDKLNFLQEKSKGSAKDLKTYE